jgi:hypothetical protein
MVKAIATSIVVVPILLGFYALFIFGPWPDFEQRVTTVDRDAAELVLTRRFILGFRRTSRTPISQIVGVRLDQNEDEGSAPRHTLSIEIRNKRRLALTRPETDRAEMETLAARLRTALRSAGWTDASGMQAAAHPPVASVHEDPTSRQTA